MSGDSYHFGDSVTMHGGQGNTGIVKGQTAPVSAPADNTALRAAVEELRQLLGELRDQVSAVNAQTIDDSLTNIDGEAGTPPEEQHRALMAVAGIAATVGAVGQPALDAVNRILELLGAR
ncbi:hypothetical protein [Streptomyces pratensis]|jgi:hypothetical protein|uniref:hypothetical protein n=1 Tax=Streptomyces pratensis TaxID=1169025 RepID=UPI0036282571